MPEQQMASGGSFDMKFYLNGFPKSGLHLLAEMVKVIAGPIDCDEHLPQPWAGTFDLNAFGNAWKPLEQTTYRIAQLRNRQYVKGHAGYTPFLERFLWYSAIAHVFVFRDFRDVAVSQAYHILNENEDFHHPAKEEFANLSFDEVLERVIVGYGPLAGVMDRWKFYQGWLDISWVLKVRFEQMVHDRIGVAKAVIDYGLSRSPAIWGVRLNVPPEQNERVANMMVVKSSAKEDGSPTYRKGKIGSWKEHFTERHKRLFKETDDTHWLKMLGYEKDEDW